MNRPSMAAATAALGLSIAMSAWSGDARAQMAPPPADPGAAAAAAHSAQPEGTSAPLPASTDSPASADGYTGPSRGAIATGLFALAISYTASVVVATSSHLPADQNDLYFPVVGPWMDIGDRPGCGPGSTPCGSETWNIIALSIDGVAQAWGVAAIVGGLFVWEHPSASVSSLRIAPTRIGIGGYGMGASGTF